MKAVQLLIFTALFWASCQNQPAPEPQKEMPAVAQQAANPANPEMKEAAQKSGGEISESNIVGMSKGTVIGKNVSIRKEAGFKAEKAGVFTSNEMVQILNMQTIRTEGEGFLNKSMVLKKSGNSITLKPQQKVLIEGANEAAKTFYISYEDPKKGRFEAEVKADVFEGRIFANWFQVKRQNGEIGWIFSNDLKTN